MSCQRAFDDPIPLVKRDADLPLLAPDDVTGNVSFVRLEDKVETLGDVVGVSYLDRAPEMEMLLPQLLDLFFAWQIFRHVRHAMDARSAI
jgi:hypothetical protein